MTLIFLSKTYLLEFFHREKSKRVGVAIGEKIIDLASLKELGYLSELPFTTEDFHKAI